MPAIPVLAPKHVHEERAYHGVHEDGDHIYIAAPVQLWTPDDAQIEELAFAKTVKGMSPNENIVWFKGSYVEADNANGNGAQWTAGELAIKSLTPKLMPVTVMHDPRTAVGVIADVKLLTPEKDQVPRSRLETALALWGHRFPEAVGEAVANARQGTLMQSMECFSPWYACSECGATYTKLPGGAEQASWCDHLKASNPHAGFVDLTASQRTNASRILGDVTFTGTGLIYGSRGAKGAYKEAHLESFMAEVAQHLRSAHVNTATTTRSDTGMGLVQIEQSELDTLRRERDEAKAEVTAAKQAQQEAERKVETVEAEKVAAVEAKEAAEKKSGELEESARKATLTDERMGALGTGFVAKLGDTTKANLKRDAATLEDAAWDTRLKEVEELVAVKRDATAENGGGGNGGGGEQGNGNGGGSGDPAKPEFASEEIAALQNLGGGSNGQPAVTDAGRATVAKGLAKAFSK